MPESLNVHAEEIHLVSEHAAESAATNHGKGTHLTAHEETVQAEDHSRNTAELASKLTHGKAASLAAEKLKNEKK